MDAASQLERGRALGARGEYEMAEAALLDALEGAAAAGDEVLLTRVRLELGELYVGLGRNAEAEVLLGQVMRTEREDGAVRAELKRATALMAHLRGWHVD